MRLTRRSLIAASAAGFALPSFGLGAFAQSTDPRKSPRVIGSATAPVTVTEFFSLTCTHCAAFTRETFPDLKAKLIDTGKVRWVFSDYPLDRIALTAAMIARSLPVDLYEPFVVALYQGQMRWAFNSSIDPIEGLAKEAALAGMPRATFDQVAADTDLQSWVLQERTDASNKYNVDATPTFRADGPTAQGVQQAGEMDFDGFTAFLGKVGFTG